MDELRKVRTGRKTSAVILAALLATVVLAGVPLSPAFADERTPPPPTGERLDHQLELCLERLGDWNDVQERNLEQAASAIDRVEQILAQAESLGMDVREGEALLAQMVSLLAAGEDHHEGAAAILQAHPGYDQDGSVVDREQAGDTCRTGRDALANGRDALLDMRPVVRNLRQLAREWRRSWLQAPAADGG